MNTHSECQDDEYNEMSIELQGLVDEEQCRQFVERYCESDEGIKRMGDLLVQQGESDGIMEIYLIYVLNNKIYVVDNQRKGRRIVKMQLLRIMLKYMRYCSVPVMNANLFNVFFALMSKIVSLQPSITQLANILEQHSDQLQNEYEFKTILLTLAILAHKQKCDTIGHKLKHLVCYQIKNDEEQQLIILGYLRVMGRLLSIQHCVQVHQTIMQWICQYQCIKNSRHFPYHHPNFIIHSQFIRSNNIGLFCHRCHESLTDVGKKGSPNSKKIRTSKQWMMHYLANHHQQEQFKIQQNLPLALDCLQWIESHYFWPNTKILQLQSKLIKKCRFFPISQLQKIPHIFQYLINCILLSQNQELRGICLCLMRKIIKMETLTQLSEAILKICLKHGLDIWEICDEIVGKQRSLLKDKVRGLMVEKMEVNDIYGKQ